MMVMAKNYVNQVGQKRILRHKSDPTKPMIIAVVKQLNKRQDDIDDDDDTDADDDDHGDNDDDNNDHCRREAAAPMRC